MAEDRPPLTSPDAEIAYFSMEVALTDSLPIFSGGLGVLAGDFLTSTADQHLPLVAVTLAYRDGYFRQTIDRSGVQHEAPVIWSLPAQLERLPTQVEVLIEGRQVAVGVWRYRIRGEGGGEVPLYLLDTNLEENSAADRAITDALYSGDRAHRLTQEIVLGIGGVAMLAALGHDKLLRFHMNEGHASLLGLALLENRLAQRPNETPSEALAFVRDGDAFTTHTPVPAGHDRFPEALVRTLLGEERTAELAHLGVLDSEELNMTELGMACSGFVNGVSLRHGEVSRAMFPKVEITSITNGVHATRWVSPSIARLFDEHIDDWRRDPTNLRYALGIEPDAIDAAHLMAKAALVQAVAERTGAALDPEGLVIGIARRATPYKQTDLLFSDPDRLRAIAERHGPIQVVFSGKAHPADDPGKELIRRILKASNQLHGQILVTYLEDYGIELARLLVAGSDCWLNTPIRPHEASGTSGMKAALNGVPSLSVLDGWWIEGCIEGVTGWAIGSGKEGDEAHDGPALYDKLDKVVAPTYYKEPKMFATIRRGAIVWNGSFFNTDRMVHEYVAKAYRLS